MLGLRLFLLLTVAFGNVTCMKSKVELQGYRDSQPVKNFREYLQIDTSKQENIDVAVAFWQRQAAELGLQFAVHKPIGKPLCVLTWGGAAPGLPSIMLNSHMDVVPAYYDEWTYPPFEAHMDEAGDIYARGAQDTKDVGVQYVEAIRRLKQHNVTLQRTIHVTLMPDEEIGGDTMKAFVDTKEFKALNVGFVLDEGLASTSHNTMLATYVDRRRWEVKFHVTGVSGHAFVMPDGGAVEMAVQIMNSILEFKEEQKKIMKGTDPLNYGAYTSVNINMINGGTAGNVIPSFIDIVVDLRLSISMTPDELMAKIHSWTSKTGNSTTVEFTCQMNRSDATPMDDTNGYWLAMNEVAEEMGLKIKPVICPARSDMLYIRNKGIPAIGFSAKLNTTSRIHGADEYINAGTFLKGIEIYKLMIAKLGDLPLRREKLRIRSHVSDVRNYQDGTGVNQWLVVLFFILLSVH